MDTYCAPLVAYLELFCYEGDVMLSHSDNSQADAVEPFNPTTRYCRANQE